MFTPRRIAILLLGTMIVTACILALGHEALCYKLDRIPCEAPGLQSFATDALSALMGLLAGGAGREDR